MSAPPLSTSDPTRLEAPLTTWFWRRSLIMVAVLVGVGAFFFYDGMMGYPRKDAKLEAAIEKREVINAQVATENERNRLWLSYTNEVGLSDQETITSLGEQIRGPNKTREQFYYAAGCGGVALIGGIFLLLQRRKMLAIDAGGLHLPDGRTVPFEQIVRVDRRKWHKGKAGLAYLFFKDKSGELKRVTIDGMKYGGFRVEEGVEPIPERIMNRVLSHEHIELLDLASQVDGEDEGENSSEAEDSASAATEPKAASEDKIHGNS